MSVVKHNITIGDGVYVSRKNGQILHGTVESIEPDNQHLKVRFTTTPSCLTRVHVGETMAVPQP